MHICQCAQFTSQHSEHWDACSEVMSARELVPTYSGCKEVDHLLQMPQLG